VEEGTWSPQPLKTVNMKTINTPVTNEYPLIVHRPAKCKTMIRFCLLFIAFNTCTLLVTEKVSAQGSVTFQIFYDDLSQYGYWVDNSDYGYVWVPQVSEGFMPYGTNGYWAFTNAGWTWISDYPWGWAPFHYGRWFYDSYYGWVWVPDYEWSPGWVVWRRSEGYFGWAPIGPGITIDFAYSNGYNLPYDRWRFVRDRDFGRENIYNYYIRPSTNTTIIKNSTVINNFQVDNSRHLRYNAGPDKTDVEQRAGKQFAPVPISETSGPGQNLRKNELELYRPQVQKNMSADRKPAPANAIRWRDSLPARQQHVQQRPTQQQPVQQRPAQQRPAQQQPVQQKRTNQPARNQPTKSKPAQLPKDHPAKKDNGSD